MTAMIDTLGYVKKLEAAGIDRKVAEAHAEAMAVEIVPKLATQADVRQVTSDLRAEIKEVRAELKQSIADLRLEIWKVSIGITLATATLSAFVQKLVK